MAALYARCIADETKFAAKQGSENVWTTVETWGERICVRLLASGEFFVTRAPKNGIEGIELLATGVLDTPGRPR